MECSIARTYSERLVRRIAREAQELLSSQLPAAGPRYHWEELLPLMIGNALGRAAALADLTPGDRCQLEAAARCAARDWIPLNELERVCQIVTSCVYRGLWGTIEPADCDAMLGLCRWAADRLPEVLGILRSAYIEEMRRLGERRVDDEVIIGTLLDGGDAVQIAHSAGRVLPDPSVLAAVVCADPPGRRGGFSFPAPPTAVLDTLAGSPGALCAPRWDKSALVAWFGMPPGPTGQVLRLVRQTAERLIAGCEYTYGRPFVAGMALAPSGGAAPRAAQEAVELAFLLARPDPPRRAAFSEDVTLELLVSGHAALRRRLAARVADVKARPDLWATLQEIYRADLDRGRTARRLGIHRSTLDYRLNRIQQLTDACPTSIHGILLFTAAQAAVDAGEPPALVAGAPVSQGALSRPSSNRAATS